MTNPATETPIKTRIRSRFGDAVADSHTHSSRHRAEIEASASCGRFYCMHVFGREQIEEWTDDGNTALCPHCGIDAVLANASGYEISVAFLTQMHWAWFQSH